MILFWSVDLDIRKDYQGFKTVSKFYESNLKVAKKSVLFAKQTS